MIQIRKAEKLPKKAITFPNPGNNIAVTTHTAVVTILDPILKTAFTLSFDLILSATSSGIEEGRGGFEIDEVNIWDSSPGSDGWIERIVSIVTFSWGLALLLTVSSERALDQKSEGHTGRVHNPNFVIGLMTIIHSANKLSIRE